MGTSSEIIISNGIDTQSFYVGFGSHKDDLGQKLKKLLNQTSGENWRNELIKLLNNNKKFQILNETRPVNITYLINTNKQLLCKNNNSWEEI